MVSARSSTCRVTAAIWRTVHFHPQRAWKVVDGEGQAKLTPGERRDLTAKRYVYFWVDGIYFSARMEEEKQSW